MSIWVVVWWVFASKDCPGCGRQEVKFFDSAKRAVETAHSEDARIFRIDVSDCDKAHRKDGDRFKAYLDCIARDKVAVVELGVVPATAYEVLESSYPVARSGDGDR